MTTLTLVRRSLRFYARSHIGALLGAAVGAAVLTGALVVGDSVRSSLRRIALAHLGNVSLALASGDRFFRAQLASDLAAGAQGPVVSAVMVPGIASAGDGALRANNVQIVGVDPAFWGLANRPPPLTAIPSGSVLLNKALAEQLQAAAGDSILLRVHKPSELSRDAPLAPEEKSTVALRVKVAGILSDEQLGSFSLQANQMPPLNAFVDRAALQQQLEQPDRANVLLAGEGSQNLPLLLKEKWTLADGELQLREVPGGIELRTSRVFLDNAITEKIRRAFPEALPVFTYFANELRAGNAATPYSMVTAMGAPIVPPEMEDSEILINQWTADDLSAKPGQRLELAYYVVGSMRQLEERHRAFKIRAILPMDGPAGDRTLMPDFPGMTTADNCRDWDTGFPIQTGKIRDKDEKYWHDYRGTPKAFVTLKAGQEMWTNRFGNLTALRFPDVSAVGFDKQLQAVLGPDLLGLSFQPVRDSALKASSQGQDFGELFLGFSFFLIVSALMLLGLLFQFSLEQRAREVGTFLALGFTPRKVRRLFFWEGVALAVLGSALGAGGGTVYAKIMLRGLATIWRNAVGTSQLRYEMRPITLISGAVLSALAGSGVVWWTLRKQARQRAVELLSQGANETRPEPLQRGWRRRIDLIIAVPSLLAAGALGAFAISRKNAATAELFFSSGGLLLVAGLGFSSFLLTFLSFHSAGDEVSFSGLGIRNATRRRKRSRALIMLIASGSFLVAAVGAFHLETNSETQKRSSGTGGFGLLAESSLPIVQNLNSSEGLQSLGMETNELSSVRFVPFRVRAGDDASCLNLNRAQKPRLLGVQATLLATRKAFTFASVAPGYSNTDPWLLLNKPHDPGLVPAIGDVASIQWALGKKVGDTLDYVDERGQTFRLLLVAGVANSILQGSLIISEGEFVKRFPSESGYRMFLIDAPSKSLDATAKALGKGLQDAGLEIVPAAKRLAAFNAVQNTYLNTFQVLGGLGLLLGSAGIGVLVLRNVHDRQGELAVFLALGFRRRALRWLLVSEHGALLILGLMIGLGSAAVAVLPALLARGGGLPVASIGLTLLSMLLSGLAWTWLAAWIALRRPLLDTLRNN